MMSPAFEKLFLAEIDYLMSMGWKQKNVGAVIEPPQSINDLRWEHPDRRILYTHEHALRAQKEMEMKTNTVRVTET